MIKYQILQGVQLQASTGLPAITISPEGRAMGSVPGWRVLIDPDFSTPTSAVNRADGLNAVVTTAEITTGTFANGATSIEMMENAPRIHPQVDFNQNAWSFFAVLQLEDAPPIFNLLHTDLTYAPGDTVLRLSTTGIGNVALFETRSASDGTRILYPGDVRGRNALVMATFSTRDGLRLFIDGVEVAANPTDTRPIAVGSGRGEWLMYHRVNTDPVGKVGMSGLLDIDLGWAEHAGYRRSIERFLMAKYGIA